MPAPLYERLSADVVAAARAKSADLTTLRGLVAALKNEEIARRTSGAAELSDNDVLQVLRREAKRRQDSIRLYEQGGRQELAERERIESAIISRYLPQSPDEAAVRLIAEKLKAELHLTGPKAIGQLVRAVMDHFGGAAEGNTVSRIARELLGS